MRGKSVKGSTTPTKTQQVVYKCTGCQKSIKSHHDAALHPLLDCLICRTCYTKYGNGDFATLWDDGVDEQGDDNYCRWCCDGGSLIGCMNDDASPEDRCHFMFCEDCLRRNVPDDPYFKMKEGEHSEEACWYCFVCDKEKLKILRSEAQEAISDLIGREPSGPLAEVTPKNPVGRSKNRDSTNAVSTPNGTAKAPASKTKQVASEEDDIDIMSLSPPKPSSSADVKEKGDEKEEEPTKKNDTAAVDKPNKNRETIEKTSKERELGDKPNKEGETSEKVAKDQEKSEKSYKDKESSEKQSKERDTGEKSNLDREYSNSRKSTSSASKDQDSTISSSGQKDSIKKLKENSLSKRDKEARVEGEPIVAPQGADLIKLGNSIHNKKRDSRRVSDSLNTSANTSNKKRKIEDESPVIKISSSIMRKPSVSGTADDKPSKSNGNETGLEPQMTYKRTSTGPSPVVDRQHSNTNGNSDKQPSRHSTHGRESNAAITSKTSSTKGPNNVPVDLPKKFKPSAADIKKRVEYYNKTKQLCIDEIGNKFEKIVEMVNYHDLNSDTRAKQSISSEIDSLRRPLQDFESMLRDLKNLFC